MKYTRDEIVEMISSYRDLLPGDQLKIVDICEENNENTYIGAISVRNGNYYAIYIGNLFPSCKWLGLKNINYEIY